MSPSLRGVGWRFVWTLFIVVLFLGRECVADDGDRAFKIRAALLYNSIKFVSFPNSQQKLTLCIFGAKRFEVALRELFAGKRIRGNDVEVIGLERVDETLDCSVAYYGNPKSPDALAHMKKMGEEGRLTTCGTNVLEWNGCMVQIYEEENRLRFGVDLQKAAHAGVKFSSEFLSLAKMRE